MRRCFVLLAVVMAVFLVGCSKPASEEAARPEAGEPAPPSERPPAAQPPVEPADEPAETLPKEPPMPQPPSGTDPAAAAGAGEMPPAGEEADLPPSITNEEELKAALLEANPGFGGEVMAGFDPRSGLIQIGIRDPAVTDITPLGNLRSLLESLVATPDGEPPEQLPPVAISLGGTAVKDISSLAEIPRIIALDLAKTNVGDLSPIRGAPIRELFLEETKIDDVEALRDMELEKLYLSHTNVSDLSPLAGAPLKELNIVGTKVSDLSPLEGSWIQMLWFSECPVEDLSPLKKMPLVSVTMEGAPVSDLSPLERHPSLRRLHIAETDVTDLTPLKWLKLTRLIFTPSRIEKGIGFVRDMETLREIGTTFDNRMPPAQFWRAYEAGAFRVE